MLYLLASAGFLIRFFSPDKKNNFNNIIIVKSKFIFHKFLLVFLLGILNTYAQESTSSIKVGVYQNPPKIFVDGKGKPDGIFIDIIEDIASEESIVIEYVEKNWGELFNLLERGEIDLLPDVAYSSRRDSLFKFNPVPVMESWLELYSSPSKNIQSILELEGRKIGVLEGSIQEYYLRNELKDDFSLDYTVLPYPNYSSSIEALSKNDIDAVLADRFLYFSDSFGEQIVPTGIVLRPTNLYLAFSKNTSPVLINKFDKNLSALKNESNSAYYKILRKWLNRELGNYLPEYLKWIIVGFFAMLLIVSIFNIILRKKVRDKTKELQLRNSELRLAKENAEESERLKTAFLQNMSHEIRTPMNGILGFLRLMKEEELDRETNNKYINIVAKSGERLLTTINNIVEVSRINSGLVKTNLRKVNVKEVMTYHFNFFKPLAVEKGLSLEMEQTINGDAALIKSDRNMLDGVLTNLINNGIKFTDEGEICFGNYLENESLLFYVRDTGAGIKEDRIKSVFNPFVQGDHEISRPYEGSGLGLSIVQEYIRLLGGKLWLDTKLGEGSTFYLSIPYNKVSALKKTEKSPGKIEFESRKILIAEDDNISFLLLKKLLQKIGLESVRAKDGAEAVELFQNSNDIDLILMDMKMPKISGFDAVREIRKFDKDIPVIAQTAFANSENKEKAMEAGFNDYITKPINKSKLITVLEQFLPISFREKMDV